MLVECAPKLRVHMSLMVDTLLLIRVGYYIHTNIGGSTCMYARRIEHVPNQSYYGLYTAMINISLP